MKFALFFAHQLPRPWAEGDEQRIFDEALEQVELGDALGIEYCWGQEHNFLEEYCHSSAPEVFLAAFSQRTKQMRIGHGIVHMPPRFNHPARVAERIATLDLLSHGRVEWGTGEAGTRMELEAFGVPYPEKRGMWEEAVRECALMMSMTPYPGCEGKWLRFPARNVVPKPVQRPHPPLWMACTNRTTLKHAARYGIGALTFAFMNAQDAKCWVEEYYETFSRHCVPIGRAVNPNVAMLSQFMCHRSGDVAVDRGLEGARFFAFGLSHYYRTGRHTPGATDVWKQFKAAPPFAMAGNLGLGSPDQVREHFEAFEEAGLDQMILLQQAGNYRHDHICESLELFGREVLPAFHERDAERTRRKAEALAPAIERAMSRMAPLPERSIAEVDCYPMLADKVGVEMAQYQQDRAPLPAAMWRMQVGGPAGRRRQGGASRQKGTEQ